MGRLCDWPASIPTDVGRAVHPRHARSLSLSQVLPISPFSRLSRRWGVAGKKTTDHGTPATMIYGWMLLHPHGKTARHVPGPPRDRQRDAARQQASRGSGQHSVGLGSAEAAPHPPEAGPPGHHRPKFFFSP